MTQTIMIEIIILKNPFTTLTEKYDENSKKMELKQEPKKKNSKSIMFNNT